MGLYDQKITQGIVDWNWAKTGLQRNWTIHLLIWVNIGSAGLKLNKNWIQTGLGLCPDWPMSGLKLD